MRVIVAGGTGLVGASLCSELAARGHTPVVLTRDPAAARQRLGPNVETVRWEPGQPGEWQSSFSGADAVINLAGESIASGRWTANRKTAIRDSRLQSTRSIVEAITKSASGPSVLLNASAVGYYGPRGAEAVDESEQPGTDFLARTCQEWERAAQAAEAHGTRVVLVRTGVVLARDGGALEKLLPPFKMYVGGPLGGGRQGFPWVHLADVIGIYVWALEQPRVSGPLNAVGPESLDNRRFAQTLGHVLERPSWAPVPGFALRLMLGEMAEALLLQGAQVVPRRTEQLGYAFRFTTAEGALRDLLR